MKKPKNTPKEYKVKQINLEKLQVFLDKINKEKKENDNGNNTN